MPISQSALIENLQQQIENFWVGLLHLVEQNDGIGPATDSFRQLTTLLVADIPRRGTNQARYGELLAVFTHIDAHEGLLVIEEVIGKRFRELRLAHTGGAQEKKRPSGTAGVAQPSARSAHRFGDCRHGGFLADQAPCELCFQVQETLCLALGELVHRNTRPRGNNGGNVLIGDLVVDHPIARSLCALRSGDRLFDPRNYLVIETRRLLVTALAHRAIEFDARIVELGL